MRKIEKETLQNSEIKSPEFQTVISKLKGNDKK